MAIGSKHYFKFSYILCWRFAVLSVIYLLGPKTLPAIHLDHILAKMLFYIQLHTIVAENEFIFNYTVNLAQNILIQM